MEVATLFAVATLLSTALATAPIVDLGHAKYRGHYNSTLNVNEYFGIPFAEPPVGELRWRAPKLYNGPKNSSSLIINATEPHDTCVQGFPPWTGPTRPSLPPGSEDCLIVNILQPPNATENSQLPVHVNIHGGGYVAGDASMQPYTFMRHSGNSFIGVTLQYRLGAYGFLGSNKFVEEGGATNVALLDQRLALEWVQKYISAFGGDPDKVSIGGGSAGGGSVTAQMTAYGGIENPPFRAATAQIPWYQQYPRDEQLTRQYEYLLEAGNCTTLSCLQALPEDMLKAATQLTYEKAYADGAYGYGTLYFGPYVDGDFLQDLPSREFQAGHFSKVPLLVDREQYEGYGFSNLSMTTQAEETRDLEIQFPYAHDGFIEDLYELYPREEFNSTLWQRVEWFGDFSINCPTTHLADSVSSYNQKAWKLVYFGGTQIHGSIGPILGGLDYGSQPGENGTLASIMKDWYTSFVMYGDPTAKSWSGIEKPTWLAYGAGHEVMSVNETEVDMVDDLYFDDDERCAFFREHNDVVQN